MAFTAGEIATIVDLTAGARERSDIFDLLTAVNAQLSALDSAVGLPSAQVGDLLNVVGASDLETVLGDLETAVGVSNVGAILTDFEARITLLEP